MRKAWFGQQGVLFVAVILCSALVGTQAVAQETRARELLMPKIVLQVAHSKDVTSVAFSPKGDLLLSGSEDRTVKLWHVASGALLRTLQGHSGEVTSVLISPDGTQLLSGSSDQSIKVWNAATGELLLTFKGHTDTINSLALTRDGSRVLSADGQGIILWSARTGTPIQTFTGDFGRLTSIALSPDDASFISTSDDNTVKIWDLQNGALIRTLEGHSEPVTSIAFAHDSSRVLTGAEKTLILWDARTGARLRTFDHDGEIKSVAFSPDGTRVLSGGGWLRLWDTADGRLVDTVGQYGTRLVAFSPDGKRVLSTDDRTLKIRDAETRILQRTFKNSSTSTGAVVFSPDGSRMLSRNRWGRPSVRVWDTLTGALLGEIDRPSVGSIAFSPDGNHVLLGGGQDWQQRQLELWDLAKAKVVRTFQHHGGSTAAAFSRDGTRIISGDRDKTLKLWNASNGKLVRSFNTNSDSTTTLAFSSTGSRALTASSANTFQVWDTSTGKLLRTFVGHSSEISSLSFSPDGSQVVSGSWDYTVKIWNASTGKLQRTLQGHSEPVMSVAFSPDGSQVTSGSWDHTVKIWSASNGKLQRTLQGHSGWVVGVAFSPDGRRVMSSSDDGTIRHWHARTGNLLAISAADDDEWITATDSFFVGSLSAGRQMAHVVRGLEVHSVAQLRDHIHRPDLLEQYLRGDPRGVYSHALAKVNLTKIVESGPVPRIERAAEQNIQRNDDTFSVTVRLVNDGGGIGNKVVWRINGTPTESECIVGSTEASSPDSVVTGCFTLDPGQVHLENVFEVIAYNGAGLLATAPFRMAYKDDRSAAAIASAQNQSAITIVPNVTHSLNVSSLAFSPDGASVVSASADHTLKLWDAASGRLLRSFAGHGSWINAVAFAPDGNRIVSGSGGAPGARDTTIKIWDTATGRLLQTFAGHEDGFLAAVTSVAFAPDGQQVLSGGRDGTAKLWDAATGQILRTFKMDASEDFMRLSVDSVAFSPNGDHVATGSLNKGVSLWVTATGEHLRTFEGHAKGVNSVVFSPDGRRLLSGSDDKTMMLWDVESGQLLRTFQGHGDKVTSAAFSSDGTRVLSGSFDKTIRLWEAETGALLQTFEERSGVECVAFSPDNDRIVAGAGFNVSSWKLMDGRRERAFGGHVAAWVTSVAFSPTGAHMLSGGGGELASDGDNLPKLWDAATGELLRTFDGHTGAINSVAFSQNGAHALSGSTDKSVRVWDVTTGALIRVFDGHSKEVRSVAFSRDGMRVLSGGRDSTAKIWDVNTGGLLVTFTGHERDITSVASSPDGARVLTGSLDKTLRLWDAATGRLLRIMVGDTYLGVTSVAFSPNGSTLVSGGHDGTLRLWDAVTGELLRTFRGHRGSIRDVAFSPDGTRLLSGGDDQTFKIWDARAGRLLRTVLGHSYGVTSVAFAHDGRRVLSGSGDTTVKVWTADGDLLITALAASKNKWLSISPDGFFNSSVDGRNLLSVVRGLEMFSIDELYDHLYRADLVQQLLKGDPEGKYRDHASRLNLESILNSGSAPQIEQTPQRKTERIDETTVRVTVRLIDLGGGIGNRVIWRVNGVTQGEISAPRLAASTPGDYRLVTQILRLNPAQKNLIEVTAYNGAGLLATPPYRIEIDRYGENVDRRPTMHILSVGVNEYERKDWRLKYAATDAKALAQLLASAAKDLYQDVRSVVLVDEEATAGGIAKAIERLAPHVSPNDVFVLFMAGHGRSVAGTYYFLPQDLNFEGGRTIMSDAVSQDVLQGWLAKIPAQKSIIILDTCESAVRGLDIERETAIERLRHATGRSIITAASGAAFEGYEGHGVLTYTILDAFQRRDGHADLEVDLYGLASHVDRLVPIISQRVFGVAQRPHNKLEGNFPLGFRTVKTSRPALDVAISRTATHALTRSEPLRKEARTDSPTGSILARGTQVRVVDTAGNWAEVARDGQKLGYVPTEALLQLQ